MDTPQVESTSGRPASLYHKVNLPPHLGEETEVSKYLEYLQQERQMDYQTISRGHSGDHLQQLAEIQNSEWVTLR